jgi:hypothetical protein
MYIALLFFLSSSSLCVSSLCVADSRAAGIAVSPAKLVESAVAGSATHAINATTSAAIKEFTGINVNPQFKPETVTRMAKTLKPEDINMMMGIMKDLSKYH